MSENEYSLTVSQWAAGLQEYIRHAKLDGVEFSTGDMEMWTIYLHRDDFCESVELDQ